MSITVTMSAANPPPAAIPLPETCTIAECNLKETIFWSMPREVYELVAIGLENWRLLHGRKNPRASVDRVLRVLEDGGCPDIRASVTRTVQPAPAPEKAIRGLKADVLITDTLAAFPASPT